MSIGMCSVISEPGYNGKIYKGIIGKLPFPGHFPTIALLNSIVRNFGSHMSDHVYI